ncbi:hypothetical protein LV75_006170 [Actinokineospora diospyrosa]|uniref:Uncharacterized protein n=1 Tax=Actinokineospora diospyrosa TaxID=103728 RepID=A0ABT1ILV2_9PSEU|nr:hypothetical protein [Actinokineospora diospyrosa]
MRKARWGGPVLCGAPTAPVAEPQSRGRKDWPCRVETLRVPSPHTKQVHPIEQLAPATPTAAGLGKWAGADLTGGGLAPTGPSVQLLGRWAGADLTAAGLAPTGPTVQLLGWQSRRGRGWADTGCSECPGLDRWVGADLTGGGMAPPGLECPGAGLAGQMRAGWVGTAGSECPGAGQVVGVGPGGGGVAPWLLSVQWLGLGGLAGGCPQRVLVSTGLDRWPRFCRDPTIGCVSGALAADDLVGRAGPRGFGCPVGDQPHPGSELLHLDERGVAFGLSTVGLSPSGA